MTTTTSATQRDLMSTAIIALVPSTLSGVRFLAYDHRGGDFRAWCDTNKTAAFRRFSIRDVGSVPAPVISDTVQAWHETEIECVVAYPNDYRYGSQMRLDQEDVAWADLNQIDDTIGVCGFATFGDANVELVTKNVEDGQSCRFAVLRLKMSYWRAVA